MERKELFRYTGNPAQVFSARRIIYAEGNAEGMSAIDVKSATGLHFTVLEGRGLDLYEMDYKGVNLAFMSKNGLTSGERFGVGPGEFLHGMNAGMMFTAGLLNVGPDHYIDGTYHPLHGTIGSKAACEVYARTDESRQTVEVGGKLQESALFGENLWVNRKITADGKSPRIVIEDTVENRTSTAIPVDILYHCNLGYPFLDEGVKLYTSPGSVVGRTPEAQAAIDAHNVMTAPIDEQPEEVFIHDLDADEKGMTTMLAVNEKLRLGVYVRASKATLPVFNEWKSMASGDYALGMEPANNRLRSRAGELEAGFLPTLEGFGTMNFRVEIGVLDGMTRINAFIAKYCK